ncbi:hypothetical protein M8818_001351 [Zalaria obscura]|uniref:Uncharacterized protein n=1 Tax=Zalaria obscura TaxID=2024903 RepID=A0ACC3SLB5_9PEZI
MATIPPRTFRLNFMGDVMLGRLIDQLFPTHINEPSEAHHAAQIKKNNPQLHGYGPRHPWGTTLPLLHSADLNLINLETSATTHEAKWPNKVFNYRMHPANISALHEAKIDYAGLANNHTLDFSEEGLRETVRTVRGAGIAFAGAGDSEDEAAAPAVLFLPRGDRDGPLVHVYAASDHPSDWASVPTFHMIDYTTRTRERLKALLTSSRQDDRDVLKVFSVHWGPNYACQPSREIQSMAHFLIDECGVDVVHGHSSHHVQGVEKYKGKLIIYGCGDFVDDYAVTLGYRNDLSAVWRVTVEEIGAGGKGNGLYLRKLEVFPTRIRHFQAEVLEPGDADHEFVREQVRSLSMELGSRPEREAGDEGQLVFNLSK